MRRGTNPRGFTLIELLVVVTIIAIVLALLTPALDQAVYRSELATCSARLKAIASGVTTYAAGQRRHYPYRDMANASYNLSWTLAQVDSGYDLRPTVAPYLTPDAFMDPLAPRVDLSPDATGPTDLVLGPYALWFGFKYLYGDAMNRIGQRMSFATTATGPKQSFSTVGSCMDSLIENTSTPRSFNAHPDSPQVMFPYKSQALPAGPTLTACQGCSVTDSRWTATTTWKRGLTEQNVAFTDGSVATYNAKPWDAAYTDPRWEKVARGAGQVGIGTDYITLPKH